MTLIQAIWLGLLQGITEFLPVSSTAHMDIASRLFIGHDVGAAYSAVVQLGPMFAIIYYFRHDLVRYLKGILRTRSPFNVPADDLDARLGWFVLLGFIPLAIFGLLLEHKIDTSFRRLDVVSVALIVLALIMLWAEMIGKRTRTLKDMTLKDSQIIGWAQVLALVPGTSRSGVTITAGLFQNLDREESARFSFLLSVPVIVAAGLYKLLKAVIFVIKPSHFTPQAAWEMHPYGNGTLGAGELGLFLFSTVIAGIFAYIVVRWFMKYMENHNTYVFIAYRIILGIAVILLLKSGKISNTRSEHPPTTTPLTAFHAPTDGQREPAKWQSKHVTS